MLSLAQVSSHSPQRTEGIVRLGTTIMLIARMNKMNFVTDCNRACKCTVSYLSTCTIYEVMYITYL